MRLLFVVSFCAWAQIETPRIGVMLDSSGDLRPVDGVASSVTVGDAVETGIASVACSRRCVTSTVPAVIALYGEAALVYSSGRLMRDGVEQVIHITGEILSMRVVDGAMEFAVRRDDGVWIVRDEDVAVGAIEGATGPVMLLDGAVLFASGDEVVLRRANGEEQRFPVRAEAFVRMSSGYVQIRGAGAGYALELRRNRLFQLPEVARQ
jgi:hypothetical protein